MDFFPISLIMKIFRMSFSKSISLIAIIFLTSCSGATSVTELEKIPNHFHGDYKLINGYEDYRIRLTSTKISDLTPMYPGEDIRVDEGAKFYLKNNWKKKHFGRPVIMCLTDACNDYKVLYFRIEDGVLLIQNCFKPDPRNFTDEECYKAHEFLKI